MHFQQDNRILVGIYYLKFHQMVLELLNLHCSNILQNRVLLVLIMKFLSSTYLKCMVFLFVYLQHNSIQLGKLCFH